MDFEEISNYKYTIDKRKKNNILSPKTLKLKSNKENKDKNIFGLINEYFKNEGDDLKEKINKLQIKTYVYKTEIKDNTPILKK